MNKLASAKASGKGSGSKVLTDLVEGLEEPGFAVELRLKIDQNHGDLKGGYETLQFFDLTSISCKLTIFGGTNAVTQ